LCFTITSEKGNGMRYFLFFLSGIAFTHFWLRKISLKNSPAFLVPDLIAGEKLAAPCRKDDFLAGNNA